MGFVESFIVLAAGALLVGLRFVPPHWLCVSTRKRNAIVAASKWIVTQRDIEISSGRIFRDLGDRLIVLIVPKSQHNHPVLYFCRVAGENVSVLGAGQCRYGQEPDDLWHPDDV